MNVYLDDGDVRILHADCIEAMAAMDEASVDAVVTDPPYGLEFMGREWDAIGRNVGPGGKRRERERVVEDREQGRWQPGSSYGAHAKNPRCQKCGRLRFDHEGRKCGCSTPAFHARASEYGEAMQEWFATWATEALRVLKPGGHLLAFGGTRTFHRLTCGLEDAGFEIRDCLSWLYGSGFPKSLDVSKAIDKAAGVERTEVVGKGSAGAAFHYGDPGEGGFGNTVGKDGKSEASSEWDITAPATEDAARWQGWGTALKPAWEPIVVARKPLAGTVAANVLEHSTGAVNVDGCRVETGGPDSTAEDRANFAGRWPANVVLDEAAAGLLGEPSRFFATFPTCGDESTTAEPTSDGASREVGRSNLRESIAGSGSNRTAQSPMGTTSITRMATRSTTTSPISNSSSEDDTKNYTGESAHHGSSETVKGDAGDAGSGNRRTTSHQVRSERGRATADHAQPRTTESGEPGTENATPSTCGGIEQAESPTNRFYYTAKAASSERGEGNTHPTVKPIDLMRWLVRLVTPPGGVVLDPFLGSGTTALACRREGIRCIGIEREAEYVEIAAKRVRGEPHTLFGEAA